MQDRQSIALETDDDAVQPKSDAQAARSSRTPAIPPFSVRDPFWWAVASTLVMVVALAFLLLVTG